MNNRDWFELWREFSVWYKKLAKSGKAPSWRKQQRMIHKLVDKKVTVRASGLPVIKRGPGRPRKHPLPVQTPGMAPSEGNKETPSVSAPVAAPATPGMHPN